MQDGKTKVESREKVISNIATEERNTAFNIIPTPTAGILLSQVMHHCMVWHFLLHSILRTCIPKD